MKQYLYQWCSHFCGFSSTSLEKQGTGSLGNLLNMAQSSAPEEAEGWNSAHQQRWQSSLPQATLQVHLESVQLDFLIPSTSCPNNMPLAPWRVSFLSLICWNFSRQFLTQFVNEMLRSGSQEEWLSYFSWIFLPWSIVEFTGCFYSSCHPQWGFEKSLIFFSHINFLPLLSHGFSYPN